MKTVLNNETFIGNGVHGLVFKVSEDACVKVGRVMGDIHFYQYVLEAGGTLDLTFAPKMFAIVDFEKEFELANQNSLTATQRTVFRRRGDEAIIMEYIEGINLDELSRECHQAQSLDELQSIYQKYGFDSAKSIEKAVYKLIEDIDLFGEKYGIWIDDIHNGNIQFSNGEAKVIDIGAYTFEQTFDLDAHINFDDIFIREHALKRKLQKETM